MHIAARLRRLTARHRWIRWGIVASLALGAGLLTNAQLARVEHERDRWGARGEALVATRDHHPDDPLSVTRVQLPVAAIPRRAIVDVPPGARVRQNIGEGEVVVAADLLAADGPARHADRGTVVVGIADPLASGATVGHAVRVVAEGVVLSERGRITDVDGEVTLVAVSAADGPAVAAAAHAGLASLLFLP